MLNLISKPLFKWLVLPLLILVIVASCIWIFRIPLVQSIALKVSTDIGWPTQISVREINTDSLIIDRIFTHQVDQTNLGKIDDAKKAEIALELTNLELTFNLSDLLKGQIQTLIIESVHLTLPEQLDTSHTTQRQGQGHGQSPANNQQADQSNPVEIPSIKQLLNSLPFISIQAPQITVLHGTKEHHLGLDLSDDPEIGSVLIKGIASIEDLPPFLIYMEFDKESQIEFFINQYNELLLDANIRITETDTSAKNSQLFKSVQAIEWTAQFNSSALNALSAELASYLNFIIPQSISAGTSDINISGSITLPSQLNLNTLEGMKGNLIVDGQFFTALNTSGLTSDLFNQYKVSIDQTASKTSADIEIDIGGSVLKDQNSMGFDSNLTANLKSDFATKLGNINLEFVLDSKDIKLDQLEGIDFAKLELILATDINANALQLNFQSQVNPKLSLGKVELNGSTSVDSLQASASLSASSSIRNNLIESTITLNPTQFLLKDIIYPDWNISNVDISMASNSDDFIKMIHTPNKNLVSFGGLKTSVAGMALKQINDNQAPTNRIVSFSSLGLLVQPFSIDLNSTKQVKDDIKAEFDLENAWGVWDDKILPKTSFSSTATVKSDLSSLSANGYIDLNKQLRLNYDTFANLTNQSLKLNTYLDQDIALGVNKLLSDFGLYDTPRLIAGKTQLNQSTSINLSPFDVSYQGNLVINDLYAKTKTWQLDNQTMNLNWSGNLNSLNTSGKVKIEKFNSGVVVENLIANPSVSLDLNSNKILADVKDTELNVLGGTVKAPVIKFDSTRPINAFGIIIEGIEMNEVLKMQQIPGVYGTGYLDGLIPVVLTKNGVEIPAGNLQARQPGGLIRLTDQQTADAIAQSDPSGQMGVLTEVLKNFNYQELLTELDMTEEGDLRLKAAFKGQNPDYLDGREVHLNTNIDFNIYPLLETLQFTSGINQKFEEHYLEQQ